MHAAPQRLTFQHPQSDLLRWNEFSGFLFSHEKLLFVLTVEHQSLSQCCARVRAMAIQVKRMRLLKTQMLNEAISQELSDARRSFALRN